MKKGKKKKGDKARVNSQLEGFEVSVDNFGEIKSSLDVDRINDFLNREVEDKKLVNRNEESKNKKDEKSPKDAPDTTQ